MLARSAGDDLVLCAVVPESWPPSPARVDAEYREHVEREAHAVLERARERIGDDVEVSTLVHHARSVPAGLLEVVEQRSAEDPGHRRAQQHRSTGCCTARRCRSRSPRAGSARRPAGA